MMSLGGSPSSVRSPSGDHDIDGALEVRSSEPIQDVAEVTRREPVSSQPVEVASQLITMHPVRLARDSIPFAKLAYALKTHLAGKEIARRSKTKFIHNITMGDLSMVVSDIAHSLVQAGQKDFKETVKRLRSLLLGEHDDMLSDNAEIAGIITNYQAATRRAIAKDHELAEMLGIKAGVSSVIEDLQADKEMAELVVNLMGYMYGDEKSDGAVFDDEKGIDVKRMNAALDANKSEDRATVLQRRGREKIIFSGLAEDTLSNGHGARKETKEGEAPGGGLGPETEDQAHVNLLKTLAASMYGYAEAAYVAAKIIRGAEKGEDVKYITYGGKHIDAMKTLIVATLFSLGEQEEDPAKRDQYFDQAKLVRERLVVINDYAGKVILNGNAAPNDPFTLEPDEDVDAGKERLPFVIHRTNTDPRVPEVSEVIDIIKDKAPHSPNLSRQGSALLINDMIALAKATEVLDRNVVNDLFTESGVVPHYYTTIDEAWDALDEWSALAKDFSERAAIGSLDGKTVNLPPTLTPVPVGNLSFTALLIRSLAIKFLARMDNSQKPKAPRPQ